MYKNEEEFLKICEESLDKMIKCVETTPEEERVPNWWGNMQGVLREVRCYIDYAGYDKYWNDLCKRNPLK